MFNIKKNPCGASRARFGTFANVKLGTRHAGIVPDHPTEFQVDARGQKCRTPDGTDLGVRW
jgi:hypothetical protein